jgi:DNA-binding NarL/FixJ family response regulator
MLRQGSRSVISVFLAHHDVLKSELLAAAFARRPDFRVAGSASTSSEAVDLAVSLLPQVSLLSTALQDGALAGFVALRRIREARPDLRCVMLLPSSDPQMVVDAFRAGAKGVFCPSQSHFGMLCRCVRRVHDGQLWASSAQLSCVMEAFARLAPLRLLNGDGHRILSRREAGVVRLVAAGLTNRDIARELALSEHTVKNYLFRIFDKLGVSSRVELVSFAMGVSDQASLEEPDHPMPEFSQVLR